MWVNRVAGDADLAKYAQLASQGVRTAGRIGVVECPGTPSAEFVEQIIDQIPFLRRTVRRWHREAPDADDLVQDTLVQALANEHLWQAGSDLRAWLFTIMRHQFLAAVAKSTRAAALARVCAVDDPVTDLGEARLVLRDVGTVLRRLPMKQRAALQLAGVEGKTYEEVAAAISGRRASIGPAVCRRPRRTLPSATSRRSASWRWPTESHDPITIGGYRATVSG